MKHSFELNEIMLLCHLLHILVPHSLFTLFSSSIVVISCEVYILARLPSNFTPPTSLKSPTGVPIMWHHLLAPHLSHLS